MKKYYSGEEILAGDKVLFHNAEGEIKCVLNAPTGDPALDWYVQECGCGLMVVDPIAGHTYLTDPEDSPDLVFIRRAE